MLAGYRRGTGEIRVSRAVPGSGYASSAAVQIAIARIAGCPGETRRQDGRAGLAG
jgi:hypothetical protein